VKNKANRLPKRSIPWFKETHSTNITNPLEKMNDLRKDFLQSALLKHFGHKKFRSTQQFEAILSVYAGKHDGKQWQH